MTSNHGFELSFKKREATTVTLHLRGRAAESCGACDVVKSSPHEWTALHCSRTTLGMGAPDFADFNREKDRYTLISGYIMTTTQVNIRQHTAPTYLLRYLDRCMRPETIAHVHVQSSNDGCNVVHVRLGSTSSSTRFMK